MTNRDKIIYWILSMVELATIAGFTLLFIVIGG